MHNVSSGGSPCRCEWTDLLGNMYFTDNRAQYSLIHQRIPIENLLWFRYYSRYLGYVNEQNRQNFLPSGAFYSSSGAEDGADDKHNKLNGVGKRTREDYHINIITVGVLS